MCLVGFVLGVFWLVVLRGADKLLDKWREQIVEIEKALSEIRPYTEVENLLKHRWHWGPAKVTKHLPWVFIFVWFVLSLITLFTLWR
jgi:hypothetical protein